MKYNQYAFIMNMVAELHHNTVECRYKAVQYSKILY